MALGVFLEGVELFEVTQMGALEFVLNSELFFTHGFSFFNGDLLLAYENPFLLFSPLSCDVLILPLPTEVEHVYRITNQVLLYVEV